MLWKVCLPDRVESTPTYDPETNSILVGCYDQFLYSLSFADGKVLWKYNFNGIVKSSCLLLSKSLLCCSYESNQVVR